MYLGYGIGGVIAVFQLEFKHKIADTDQRLWIIVGDLPSAYVVVEPQDSAQKAIERYCEVMDGWIAAVLSLGDFSDVFPVNAPRTAENAELLRLRLDYLRAEIIPRISN